MDQAERGGLSTLSELEILHRAAFAGSAELQELAEEMGRRYAAVAGAGHVVDVPLLASEPNRPKTGR